MLRISSHSPQDPVPMWIPPLRGGGLFPTFPPAAAEAATSNVGHDLLTHLDPIGTSSVPVVGGKCREMWVRGRIMFPCVSPPPPPTAHAAGSDGVRIGLPWPATPIWTLLDLAVYAAMGKIQRFSPFLQTWEILGTVLRKHVQNCSVPLLVICVQNVA